MKTNVAEPAVRRGAAAALARVAAFAAVLAGAFAGACAPKAAIVPVDNEPLTSPLAATMQDERTLCVADGRVVRLDASSPWTNPGAARMIRERGIVELRLGASPDRDWVVVKDSSFTCPVDGHCEGGTLSEDGRTCWVPMNEARVIAEGTLLSQGGLRASIVVGESSP